MDASTTLNLEEEVEIERRLPSDAQWGNDIELYWLKHWQIEAIKALYRLGELMPNWDRNNSAAPTEKTIDLAKSLLVSISIDNMPVPRVLPLSQGGVQIEWRVRQKLFEVAVLPESPVEYLKAEDGQPIEEGIVPSSQSHLRSIVSWLLT